MLVQDLAAVDATCARLMGLDPLKMPYLSDASRLSLPGLGAIEEQWIEQRGESLAPHARAFAVIEHFNHLRLAA